MKLIFHPTDDLREYEAYDVKPKARYDGQLVDVPVHRVQRLMQVYPRNFEQPNHPLYSEMDSPLKKVRPIHQKLDTPLTELNSTPLVSILIPQRGRPNYIKKCLELILENTSYPNYEVILICDRDDLASVSRIPEHKKIKVVTDPSPKRQMYVGKINYGYEVSKGKYIVYLANDVEVGKKWLTKAVKAFQGVFPDGLGLVALFNRGAVHGLLSRKFIKKALNGRIFYPQYIHYYCDAELKAIAKKLNKYYVPDRDLVVHKCPEDNLKKEGYSKSFKQGKQLYRNRSQLGFPPSIPPNIKLGKSLHKPICLSDITVISIDFYPNVLEKYLLPCLPKEIEFIKLDNRDNKNWDSIAKALNYGIEKAKNDIVICVHPDLILEEHWFDNFIKQESTLNNWGALGIVGKGKTPNNRWVTLWGRDQTSPRLVDTLDDCCCIINKKNRLWFDENLLTNTWHCYAVDFCLQCQSRNLEVYIMAGASGHAEGGVSLHNLPHWAQGRFIMMKLIREKWKDKFPIIHHT